MGLIGTILINCLLSVEGTLFINFFLSVLGYCITYHVIPKFRDMFLKANLCGVDLGKGNNAKM